jgi:hypothetical protein
MVFFLRYHFCSMTDNMILPSFCKTFSLFFLLHPMRTQWDSGPVTELTILKARLMNCYCFLNQF